VSKGRGGRDWRQGPDIHHTASFAMTAASWLAILHAGYSFAGLRTLRRTSSCPFTSIQSLTEEELMMDDTGEVLWMMIYIYYTDHFLRFCEEIRCMALA